MLYINLAGNSWLLNWPLKPDRLETMLQVVKPSQQAGAGGTALWPPVAVCRGP